MLTQYRYFAAIIDHGGVTAAAHALAISQPAISRSLQSLEFQFDAKLIDRATWQLTPIGAMVLQRARLLLAEQGSLMEDVKALAQHGEAQVFVNGAPMTAVVLMRRIITRLAATHTNIRVSVRGDNGANYAWKHEALLKGDLDVALTIIDPAHQTKGLVQLPLFEPELRVIVRRTEEGASRISRLEELIDRRWIMPPMGSSPRAVVENEFRLCGLEPPRDTIEISDWRIALDLVRETNWVTAIPYHPACFEDQFDRLEVLTIPFKARPLGIGIYVRPFALRRPATAAFIEAATETVSAYGSAPSSMHLPHR
ncbi:MAG: LysR family transcriptional regulator [Sphingobium sp.]|jgi:DNA-binding transcriptional LysR family regulator|nr:LysR family transcriptional regulator [Sphingobium sp.]MCI1270731.1 LysR family transcriptional regulator [Sphingobium sp.]MCI1755139.1 LysR family transcriptional regulator [Sphingobium sp.]MCI2053451.1 LysR family transcriptional regulator [Sphingobium sp.]